MYVPLPCGDSRVGSHFLLQLSFEAAVMKGLAADGGLFLPEEIPIVSDWVCFLDRRPSLYGPFHKLCLWLRRLLLTHLFQPTSDWLERPVIRRTGLQDPVVVHID
jgi:hypothetical protein